MHFCAGSGLDWPVQHTALGNVMLLSFLRSTTFASLDTTIENLAPRESALRAFVRDACRSGLADVRINQKSGDLSRTERTLARGLALRHLAFPEAGYVLPSADSELLTQTPSDMAVVFHQKGSK